MRKGGSPNKTNGRPLLADINYLTSFGGVSYDFASKLLDEINNIMDSTAV